MATRTVRLDAESERTLKEVQDATGLPISEVLKRGLSSLREQVRNGAGRRAYDVYAELDLGRGGRALAPSADVKPAVRQALKKKYSR